MLSSEFSQEIGALVRRLEGQVRNNPDLQNDDLENALAHIEKAIVILCALHIKLRGSST